MEIFVYVPALDQVLKSSVLETDEAPSDLDWYVTQLPQNIYFFGEYVMMPAEV